jgi:addiction module HigA family antidote
MVNNMRELTKEEQTIIANNEANGFEYRKEHTSTKAAPYRRLPGHVLVEEFLVPYFPADLHDLAQRTHIPYNRLRRLIRGQDRIDQSIANKLAKFFRNKPEYWLELQKRFERGESL